MGFVLIWITSLAAILFFLAIIYALFGRLKNRNLQLIVPLLAAIAIFSLSLYVTLLAWLVNEENLKPGWLFSYALTWTIAYTIGFVLVRRRAIGAKGEALPSGSWPLFKLTGAIVAALVIMSATVAIMDSPVRSKLLSAQQEAVALAKTLQPAEVPDDLNAAIVYRKAFDEMGDLPRWVDSASWKSDFDWTSGKINDYLQSKQKALELIKRAAKMNDYYIDTQTLPFDPFETLHMIEFKNAVKLLSFDSKHKATNGNLKAALETLAVTKKIAGHVSKYSNHLTSIVVASITSIYTTAIEDILGQADSIPAGFFELPIDNRNFLQGFASQVFMGEKAYSLNKLTSVYKHPNFFCAIGNERSPLCLADSILAPFFRIVFAPHDLDAMQILWEKVNHAAAKPIYKALEDIEKLQKEIEDNPGGGPFALNYHRFGIIAYLEQIGVAEVRVHLSNLALAATAYKAKNGAYPASMDALTPDYIAEIPVDPFDGKPLRMAAVDGGLVLYSVGPDGKDDGGAEEKDITFVLGSAYDERRLQPAKEASLWRLKNKGKGKKSE